MTLQQAMKKYYIEIIDTQKENAYILQSCWFNSKKDAIKWAEKIVFMKYTYNVYLMSAVFDEDGLYSDIMQEQEIIL